MRWWPAPVATLRAMVAAYVWHWWLGLVMLIAGVLAFIGLTIGYLKQVTAQRHPPGKRGREREL